MREQESTEEERKQKRYREELETEEMKLKRKSEYEKKNKSKNEREQNLPQVRFPKLTISKFESTHLDWQRFGGQFEREIDIAEFANPYKINEFYETLVTHVQALETMGKLKEIKGYVRLTLYKLPSIKSDLVRTDDRKHDWDFEELAKELSKCVDRHPVKSDPKHDKR